ncbi:MAG: error-prone DNA polymerase [Magnetovibrio sp.]|nr:error-prone DNA polymerase [Magnetovibrio sp.]
MIAYAELCVASNFSFLIGASHPEELVKTAKGLGLEAIAITDLNSVTGLVRAHMAAKEVGIRLVIGCRLSLTEGLDIVVYPQNRDAYSRLTRLLTLGKRRAPKGKCHIELTDLLDISAPFACGKGQIIGVVMPKDLSRHFYTTLEKLFLYIKKNIYLIVSYHYNGNDEMRIEQAYQTAKTIGIKLLASNDIHYHHSDRLPLYDILTCIREDCTLYEPNRYFAVNAERHLKSSKEMVELFVNYQEAITASLDIVKKCTFSLDELRYNYPIFPMPKGRTPQQELTRLTYEGAMERYPQGVPNKIQVQIKHELKLVKQLNFAPYFLVVHDLVRFAEERDIFCQGRGSAANSTVCYCLRISAVDPACIDLLFERFINAERGDPPDIDIDFENDRREDVIQYVYEKYGREHAGMTATIVTYRMKSAIQAVGKALGVSEDIISTLKRIAWRRSWQDISVDHIRNAGLNSQDPKIKHVILLSSTLSGFPRYLSQHTGGMVITHSRLDEMVPIANAAMDRRTVIEWDKNDLDALGMLKIDILALGMLGCIHKAFNLLEEHHGHTFNLANVPSEDPAVYDMLCRGDSVGVFQVESRAQMSMLPRLKPRNFYDLVIEVAIVRPGPIQGKMVHPYLRRRNGKEAVDKLPSDALRQILGKTLGIPLFQEQAMKIAIVAASFTPQEADQLRRALATFRHIGEIDKFRERFINGMLVNGYELNFSDRCFKQIEGFADYGFPESHAASFAFLVYISAWLKCYYPAAFSCALLNSMPMGFYAPAQIVRDAIDHKVEVRPVDVNQSGWDHTLESCGGALRLGFRQIKGIRQADIETLIQARTTAYGSIYELRYRSGLSKVILERLAYADVFSSLGLTRREAIWTVQGLGKATLALFDSAGASNSQEHDFCRESIINLPVMSLKEQVANDYRTLSLSLKSHPLALLRKDFALRGCTPLGKLSYIEHGQCVRLAGLVTSRQSPSTAKGVMFITLEDETANTNLIVWPNVFERFRREILSATLLEAAGKVQKEGLVIHVISHRLWDLTPWLKRQNNFKRSSFDIYARNFH